MVLRKKVDLMRKPRVFIFGAGKVGTSLSRGLRAAGYTVQLRAARRGVPKREIAADFVILAVRDPSIGQVAKALADARVIAASAIVVHTAGALGPEVLMPLAAQVAGAGQMHPLYAFAAPVKDPRALEGALVLATGDAPAVRMVKKIANSLGLRVAVIPKMDRARYHAAAALLANGTATLAALACALIVEAGLPKARASGALAALLRSVALNLETVGSPHLLTGPVRRGDLQAVRRQAAILSGPALQAFRGLLPSQLELARAIGDAPKDALDAIARWRPAT